MKRRLRTRRSGVTLLELLVVATIMLTLTAVSVPAIKPMMEARLTTSGATSVSTYLNRARARAMSTGRPCGVTFEFFDGTCADDPTNWSLASDVYSPGSAALVLRQVETPPYYCGLTTPSTVSTFPNADRRILLEGGELRAYPINLDGTINTTAGYDRIINAEDDFAGRTIRPLAWSVDVVEWETFVGSENSPKIQFNATGPYYSIVRGNSDAYYIVENPGIALPSRVNASFKIARDPRATMSAPIGLPQGAVVDLAYSGTDARDFALGGDVTIMFGPSGEVDYVADRLGKWTANDSIYLMIGRWDRVAALASGDFDAEGFYVSGAEDGIWNYEDASNRWVTINPRSGIVSTVEVMPPSDYGLVSDVYAVKERSAVLDSREFARNSKRNIGAR